MSDDTEPWDTTEVQSVVIEELQRLTGRVVDNRHARAEAKRLLDSRPYRDPVAYIRGALRKVAESDRLDHHLPTGEPAPLRDVLAELEGKHRDEGNAA